MEYRSEAAQLRREDMPRKRGELAKPGCESHRAKRVAMAMRMDEDIGMEDGPEAAEGTYTFDGVTYRLEERESEVWSVYQGERFVGDVIAAAIAGAEGPRYTVRFADERVAEADYTDEWQSALEYLVRQTDA